MEEKPVTADRLLLWLSAKGSGSWPQFRAAVERFYVSEQASWANSEEEAESRVPGADLPRYQQARMSLQRLGHVEFLTENRWRMVPPVVALFSDETTQGLLCGARSREIIDNLDKLPDIEMQVSAVLGSPSRIVLRASSKKVLADRIRSLGFHVQQAAPVAMLSTIPGIHDSHAWSEFSIPGNPGWDVHCFSKSVLLWKEVAQTKVAKVHTGLFRFTMGYRRFYCLRWRGCSYEVPVQAGKYAVMRRKKGLIAYNGAQRVLSVPAIMRPPLLIERALVLCSGFLPRFDPQASRLEYDRVPLDVARLAAQLLCQELR